MCFLPSDHSMLNERRDGMAQDLPEQGSNIEFETIYIDDKAQVKL